MILWEDKKKKMYIHFYGKITVFGSWLRGGSQVKDAFLYFAPLPELDAIAKKNNVVLALETKNVLAWQKSFYLYSLA